MEQVLPMKKALHYEFIALVHLLQYHQLSPKPMQLIDQFDSRTLQQFSSLHFPLLVRRIYAYMVRIVGLLPIHPERPHMYALVLL